MTLETKEALALLQAQVIAQQSILTSVVAQVWAANLPEVAEYDRDMILEGFLEADLPSGTPKEAQAHWDFVMRHAKKHAAEILKKAEERANAIRQSKL